MKKRILAITLMAIIAAFAEIPQMVNYQGKLTDPEGVAYEGILTVTFTIYDAETGGTALWTESQNVEISHGLFDVRLGTLTPLTEEIFTGERYLEISIGAETLAPRQPFTSVPFAYRAEVAESLVGGGVGGNNLDQAYDASPSGNKRIDADDGAMIVESGASNGAISSISGSSTNAALYANNTAGGNAIWADENIFANDADIVAQGNIEVENGAGTRTAGMVGTSGNFWLHGRIDMKNDKTIFAENTSGTPMAIFTPLNFENNVVLSMADGNNFYIQDNTYANIAQFSGGSTSLFLYGDLSMDSPSGVGDFDILMNDNSVWDAEYIETNYIQDGEDAWVNVLDNLETDGDLRLTGTSRTIDFDGGQGDITSPTGIDIIIDDDATSTSSEFRVRHDATTDLFHISEAQYIAIEPRTTEPSGTPDGGIYVNGNATGSDSLFFYDGTDWTAIATTGMLGDSYIENQYATEQFARFRISGKGHIHNTIDGDTAFIATQGGANTIGLYSRGGSSAGSVALVAERPTESNYAELANADNGVYGEVDADGEVGVYGLNPANSGTATGIKGEASGAGGTTHIGVHGIASGASNNYGGYFEGDLLTTGSLQIGNVPNDPLPDSILTLVDGVVYRADASAFGADDDWQIGTDVIYNTTDSIGIGTSSPDYELDVRDRMGIATADESNFLTISASATDGPTFRYNADDNLVFTSGLVYAGVTSSDEQMRLTGDGNLGIGSSNPLSRIALDGDGAGHYGMFIEGPSTSTDYQTALYIHSNNFSSDPPDIYNRYHGIYVDQDPATSAVYHPSAIYGNMSNVTMGYSTGVLGRALGTGSDGGRTYGVKGYAGGGSDHYNYAVYGELVNTGAREGTAILGYDAIDHATFDGTLITGNWAGYFHGNMITTDRTYFGDTDVYIRQDGSNNMILRDPNTNGGSEVTLSDLYSGGSFIQNQSSSWQDAWFQIQKEISTSGDGVAEIDFSADIVGGSGYGSAYGINITSNDLDDKGAMIGLDVSTGINPVSHPQSGGAAARLAHVTGYDLNGKMIGVTGTSNPDVLSNFDGTATSQGIGVKGTVSPTTTLTLDGTGTYWVGGVYGAISGDIDDTPSSGAVAGIIGVDNNTGTATSYAGYFDGDVFASGEIQSGTRVFRGECETNDAQIRYRNTSGGSWDYQEEKLINYGRSTSLAAGYWDYSAYRYARTLIKFDLTDIPTNANIISAEIKLYCSSANGSGSYGIYKMRRHWDEGDYYCGKGLPSTYGECDSTDITGGCSWEYYSGTNSWGTAGANNTSTDRYSTSESSVSISSTGWKTWDVTSAIQDIVDGTAENYGFIIIGPTSGSNNVAFKSSECAEFELKPRLEVEWTY